MGLVFEIELLSWVSKDDLFGDEGVIRTMIVEGTGWRMPKAGEEVLISLKTSTLDGELIDEQSGLEYVLGSPALGYLTAAVDRALVGMKRNQVVSLRCTKQYAREGYSEGVVVELTLSEIYELKDVSVRKDGSVTKKQVREGQGYETPREGAKVSLKVEAATNGEKTLAGFEPRALDFTLGNGEVCEALEYAVEQMKKGERALITSSRSDVAFDSWLCCDAAVDKAVLTVELVDFVAGKAVWDMSHDEKIEYASSRKDIGGNLFKAKRTELALGRYSKVVEAFSYLEDFPDDLKQKAKELKKACELNRAACYLKVDNFSDAKKSSETVLKEDPTNTKALYRRAQASHGLKDFADCIRDMKQMVMNDPQNAEFRKLLEKARTAQKEEDRKAKATFAKMCGNGDAVKRPADATQAKGASSKSTAVEPAKPSGFATYRLLLGGLLGTLLGIGGLLVALRRMRAPLERRG